MRRGRSLAVLVILAAAALALIASTQTWFSVALVESPDTELAVPGASAIPLLAPLSLAALAGGAALSIVGRVLRLALGALTTAIGVILIALITPVAGGAVGAVAPSVTTATGIEGLDAVTALISGITATAWPVLTVLAGFALAGAGAFTLSTGLRWPSSGRRYRTDASSGLARSESPVDDSIEDAEAADGSTSTPVDAIDAWDGLSRGDDPTGQGSGR